jgi:hypothetical protein
LDREKLSVGLALQSVQLLKKLFWGPTSTRVKASLQQINPQGEGLMPERSEISREIHCFTIPENIMGRQGRREIWGA